MRGCEREAGFEEDKVRRGALEGSCHISLNKYEAAGGQGEQWVNSLCCRAELTGQGQGLDVEDKGVNGKNHK